MVAITQFTVAAALISTAFSAPTASAPLECFQDNKAKAGSIKVHQVSKGTRANGVASYLKALKKHGGSMDKVISLSKIAASSVTATSVGNDLEYICPVTIGSQIFHMDFDTGSSDLWVLGQSLAKKASAGHTLYRPGSSAVLQKKQTWSITYGDGSTANGNVYADTVTIGSTTVKGQDVERASSASGSFLGGASDGLLGLAFDVLNTVSPTQASTFFTNAQKQGLPRALFTANLNKGAPGSYEFGGIDPTSYSGNIVETPVDSSSGFWMFTPSGYSIGTGQTVVGAPLTGIADTGTTLMLVDANIAASYWAQVPGSVNDPNSGGYVFPCAATLPNFTLNINGYNAVVPGSYMNYASEDGTTCFGGLQSDAGIGFAVYGDIFLKSQFVVFDNSGPSPALGFANKASSTVSNKKQH